jgi:hypothetical protein
VQISFDAAVVPYLFDGEELFYFVSRCRSVRVRVRAPMLKLAHPLVLPIHSLTHSRSPTRSLMRSCAHALTLTLTRYSNLISAGCEYAVPVSVPTHLVATAAQFVGALMSLVPVGRRALL